MSIVRNDDTETDEYQIFKKCIFCMNFNFPFSIWLFHYNCNAQTVRSAKIPKQISRANGKWRNEKRSRRSVVSAICLANNMKEKENIIEIQSEVCVVDISNLEAETIISTWNIGIQSAYIWNGVAQKRWSSWKC